MKTERIISVLCAVFVLSASLNPVEYAKDSYLPIWLLITYTVAAILVVVRATLSFTNLKGIFYGCFITGTLILSFGGIADGKAYEYPVLFGFPFRYMIPSPDQTTMVGISVGLQFAIPLAIALFKGMNEPNQSVCQISGSSAPLD